MRTRKRQKTRAKASTVNGSSRSAVEEEDVRPRFRGQTEYERERQLRMEENSARLEALGLPKLAASLARNRSDGIGGKNGVGCKEDDDEDYSPGLDVADGEYADELDSASSEGIEDDDEDYGSSKARSSSKNKNSGARKRASVKKAKHVVDSADEEEALKKAIAASLEEPQEALNVSQSKAQTPQPTGKKKGRKSITRRVAMNEDDIIIHFCQLDEAGKGSITVRDLEKMALSHDFTWTDKELKDMIRCFNRDGNGQLSMEDFRNIVVKCNMLQTSEDT